jgi:hypothetical protein
LRGHDAVFTKMTTERIDQLGPLTNQKVAHGARQQRPRSARPGSKNADVHYDMFHGLRDHTTLGAIRLEW